MKKLRTILLTITSMVLFAENTLGYSPKEGNVTATLGTFLYRTHFPNSTNGSSSDFLPGLGLVANGDINNQGALEVGIFDIQKRFFREQDGLFMAEQTEVLHITMGYRYWVTSRLSCSLSGYSAFSLGPVSVVYNDFYPGSLETSARDIVHYGFDFSAQAELWSQDRYAAVLEGRYSLAMSERPGERADHYLFMLAVRYLVQSKGQ
ncbi:MAG: hypothetical protein K2X47_15285 [Bdellovibrionales bacterium]|nr:hypothetical protein [Bdellovibrionales bacterium]